MVKKAKQPESLLLVQASRPPVIAVLGHVDHGKTTLLDTIRKANVVSREHGGITQHIGAYQITVKIPLSRVTKGSREIPNGSLDKTRDDFSQERKITFIDTPGHEAFAKIRSRGASVADIAILVVAADDSVKPQTIESIKQIKDAGTPMVVVINKIDVQGAMVDKVKSDLGKVGVQLEGFGGDVPFQAVSATKGTGIPELLELLLLVSDMKGLTGDPKAPLSAVVIETRLDKSVGLVATVVVKEGTLTRNMTLYEFDEVVAKVRALLDETGKQMMEVGPGTPCEIMGFTKLPIVGSIITNIKGLIPRKVVDRVEQPSNAVDFLATMLESDKKKLKLSIKADVSGSLEAILEALPSEKVEIVRTGLGDITEADILEAKATGSIMIGFNVKANAAIEKLARIEKVIYRTYSIIYELLDEMNDVVEGMAEVLSLERELGKGTIIAEFPFDKDRIAGTKISAGRLARGDSVRIMRKDEEIARVRIKSLHRGKDDITKVEAGGECGVLFDKKVDFMLQDDIIPYTTG